jgi:hypothetical protein
LKDGKKLTMESSPEILITGGVTSFSSLETGSFKEHKMSTKRIVRRREATCGYDFEDVDDGTSPLNTPQNALLFSSVP